MSIVTDATAAPAGQPPDAGHAITELEISSIRAGNSIYVCAMPEKLDTVSTGDGLRRGTHLKDDMTVPGSVEKTPKTRRKLPVKHLTKPAEPAKRVRRSITKKMIMDISATMFQTKGFDRTTMDEIAKALLITKPSLYYHFASKEEILLECIEVGYLHLREELAQQTPTTATGREQASIFLKVYLKILEHEIGLAMITADDRVMSGDAKRRYNTYRTILNGELEKRLQAGIVDGSLKPIETRLTTYAIFGMFNWVSQWHTKKKDISLEQILQHFLEIVFNGIG